MLFFKIMLQNWASNQKELNISLLFKLRTADKNYMSVAKQMIWYALIIISSDIKICYPYFSLKCDT